MTDTSPPLPTPSERGDGPLLGGFPLEAVTLESVLARHSFKQVQPQVWRRGRRYGRRHVAYLTGSLLTVAWHHMSRTGAVTLDFSSMTANELDRQLSSLTSL